MSPTRSARFCKVLARSLFLLCSCLASVINAALLILSLLPYRPVWLLDEPFEALDDSAQALLAGKINTQISHGGTVLLTSHFSLPESLTVTRQIDLADL